MTPQNKRAGVWGGVSQRFPAGDDEGNRLGTRLSAAANGHGGHRFAQTSPGMIQRKDAIRVEPLISAHRILQCNDTHSLHYTVHVYTKGSKRACVFRVREAEVVTPKNGIILMSKNRRISLKVAREIEFNVRFRGFSAQVVRRVSVQLQANVEHSDPQLAGADEVEYLDVDVEEPLQLSENGPEKNREKVVK